MLRLENNEDVATGRKAWDAEMHMRLFKKIGLCLI